MNQYHFASRINTNKCIHDLPVKVFFTYIKEFMAFAFLRH